MFLEETKVDVDDIDADVDAIAYRILSFYRYQKKRVFFCEEQMMRYTRQESCFFVYCFFLFVVRGNARAIKRDFRREILLVAAPPSRKTLNA